MIVTVAELATNWLGNYEILENMLQVCKKSGLATVKFQSLSKEKIDRHPELDWYGKASVTEDNVEKINDICHACGLVWFCTPFYKEAVDFLDDYVPFYKVSFAERNNTKLIDELLATGKKVIISTDKPMYDISKEIFQVYCVPNYPTSFGDINFDMIKDMRGYSNHCMDPLALLKAKRVGAEYIEFHMTADSSRFAMDNKVSFNFGQVEEIMKWIK